MPSAIGAGGCRSTSLPSASTAAWSACTPSFGARKKRFFDASSISARREPPLPSRSDIVFGLTSTWNAWAREPAASVRRRRSTSSAADASETTMPSPAQVGHFLVRISRGPSVTFWRVISTRPSGEISTT